MLMITVVIIVIHFSLHYRLSCISMYFFAYLSRGGPRKLCEYNHKCCCKTSKNDDLLGLTLSE